jgi:hypothetical protein
LPMHNGVNPTPTLQAHNIIIKSSAQEYNGTIIFYSGIRANLGTNLT